MLAGTLAFIVGIYSLMQFSSLPSLFCLLLLPVLLILHRKHIVFRYLFYFYLGFCWVLIVAYVQTSHGLEPKIENEDVIVTGVITSVPEIRKDHSRFLIELETLSDKSGNIFKPPELARLSWYKSKIIPKPGEKWQFTVRMKRPYSFMNSGGFDYEAWMLRQGIKATGYVKQSTLNKKIKDTNRFFIEKQRDKVANQLKQQLDNPLLGLVLALSLGERSQLNAEQWQVLTHTGTNHLIAISGLHLGLIAGFAYFIAYFIWRQFYFLTQRLPAPYFASLAAFAVALIYALLSGFALPAQRALIMLGVFLVSLIQTKKLLISNVISIAAILILILDPFAVIAVDLYLSFMAVMFILYLTRFRINKQHKLTKWIVLQCLLSLCLVPVLILWFKQIPLYSIAANLVAIPVIGFLIVPLSLIALLFLFLFPSLAENIY
ncbi:MAG: ComEC/Rec2 family competence protein, partial [Gammaproteobacteria bacterium]